MDIESKPLVLCFSNIFLLNESAVCSVHGEYAKTVRFIFFSPESQFNYGHSKLDLWNNWSR